MQMKKILTMMLVLAMSVGVFTGCGKKNQESQASNGTSAKQETLDRKTIELQQNDYRGGVTRMQAVQANIFEVMETMKSNNIILREDSPNSFWGAEGYQDFVATFLDIPIIADTCWFNEEEGDWETTLSMMATEKNSFTAANDDGTFKLVAKVVRNEKDDYSVSGVSDKFFIEETVDKKTTMRTYEGQRQWRVLYDCDKDWCKAYCTQEINKELPNATVQMFEYMRVDDNTFIVQTSRERLMVVLKPVEKDTDLREREIKEFYYSKLVQEGMRTTFTPYEALPEYDEATETKISENQKRNEVMAENVAFNESGDIAVLYGQNDSVFFRSPSDISPENFIFEDKSLQQAICYKDGVLVVTTFNKLSETYERFTYSMKDANTDIAGELEKLVEINNLVGIQELPEIETDKEEFDDEEKDNDENPAPTETESEEDTEETEPMTEEETEPTEAANEEASETAEQTPEQTQADTTANKEG